MVSEMKWALSLLCLSVACAAELTPSHSVYVLSMNHSLDQFIANRLARTHTIQVVTDPAKADAVLSDHVGEALETKLDDLYPPPDKPKHAKADKDAPKGSPQSMFGDTANQAEKQGNMAIAGHSRGTVFLVDVHSRQVLWSDFDPPKNTTPHELDRTAGRIVKRLTEDLLPKKEHPPASQ